MSKLKATLPDNWRPCEVNEVPYYNQYQINEECFFLIDKFCSLSISEEEEQSTLIHVGLYKQMPTLASDEKKTRYTNHNWKPCI
jgi:hypothetical protein